MSPFSNEALLMKGRKFSQEEQALFTELLMHRRDVRGNNFLPDDISTADVDEILYAASLAPSVGLSQPWEFVVIRDQSIKQAVYNDFIVVNEQAQQTFSSEQQHQYSQLKLEGILEAPVNIAVFYKPSAEPVLGQHSMEQMGEYSVVCAVQNIWLKARAMNIGVGWVSIINPAQVSQLVKAPADRKLVAYLCVGRVKEFYQSPELEMLQWNKRKAVKSVTFDDNFPS